MDRRGLWGCRLAARTSAFQVDYRGSSPRSPAFQLAQFGKLPLACVMHLDTPASCPIETAWAEPCGKWRAGYEDGSTKDFDSEEAAGHGWVSLAPLLRLPDGREFVSSELPPGTVRDVSSIWDGYPKGADGLSIIVVLPNGDHWNVDSRASNCTLPHDNVHRCWCRHGDPRATRGLHVDKVGVTCAAGAGSIMSGGWHGFLHQGYLVEGDHQIPRGAGPVHREPITNAHPMLQFAQAPVPIAPRDPRRVGGWGS